VSGKGGTGKTTVAAALALALAAGGRRTLLMEVEGRQGLAQIFDVPPLPYEERRVAVAEGGGEVHALAVDMETALIEYLDLYYHLGRAGRGLRRLGVFEFATTIAPGVRDVLLTGKAYEAVRRTRAKGDPQRVYDAVVMDAPPTGRITRFLNVNNEVAGLAKVGPIRRQADAIMTLMRSQRTAVHLVTLLEEMPTQETVDAAGELRAARLPVGAVIVNKVQPPLLRGTALQAAARGHLDRGEVVDGLTDAGLSPSARLVDALEREGQDHALRVQLERRERKALKSLGQPMYELPMIPDGIELGALFELARELQGQGAV
jgi:anion-transporting  ArsA/GET3 family ATPase